MAPTTPEGKRAAGWRRGPASPTTPLSLRLPNDTRAALVAAAEAEGVSVSALVQRAIEDVLADGAR